MPLITTFGAGSVRGLGRAARLVPPGAPTSFSATGRTRLDGAGGATVSWTAPVDNGGAPITSYQVQNVSTMAVSTVYNPGDVVTLSNNVEQGFRIRAVNAAGPGEWSSTDLAIAGYWTYNPSNGGGSNTFTVPSGINSFVYQLFSNGGATSKPDTRTYSLMYPRANIDWWGPSVIYSDFGLPYHMSYHRQVDYYGWYNYNENWHYIYGYLQYGWGNVNSGGHEYYYMYTYNSGENWSGNSHYGYAYWSPSAESVQTGGSPAQGPTGGGSSSISVPGWGSDNTSSGYGGTSSATSGTAYANPGTNVTVSIGASSGDYSYSSPGYAVIAYAR